MVEHTATHLKFSSKDDAIAFAERQGYPYFVQEPPEYVVAVQFASRPHRSRRAQFKPKSYAANYLYNPGPLRLARTK
jgi:NADH dehydrogenase (ubiquinone) Fe-S protein 4